MSELGIEVAVDRPEVLADARAAFHRYEQALAEGDLAVLDELIWDDPRTVRYGWRTGSGAPTRSPPGEHSTRRSRRGGDCTGPRC